MQTIQASRIRIPAARIRIELRRKARGAAGEIKVKIILKRYHSYEQGSCCLLWQQLRNFLAEKRGVFVMPA